MVVDFQHHYVPEQLARERTVQRGMMLKEGGESKAK